MLNQNKVSRRSHITSRLQRPQIRPPIGADIYNSTGRKAYAQIQDEEWITAGKPPFSSWVARTIYLHSLNQGTASGIRRAELNLSLLTPGLEVSFVDRALSRLTAVAWYLNDIHQALKRNPAERISLNAKVKY